MRIVTWNVNSLKARLPRVTEWIDEVRPEVLCLQETKMADEAFPALDFEALGYTGAHFGQGRWNGVAIISRVGLDDVALEDILAGFGLDLGAVGTGDENAALDRVDTADRFRAAGLGQLQRISGLIVGRVNA